MLKTQKTAAIFLTYKNRYNFFSPLIQRLLSMRVSYIIIVDNNASDESKLVINDYTQKYPGIIHVVVNEKNVGTAIGFTQGMQCALQLGAEYLWLLDDDLMPEEDALDQLFRVWEELENGNKKSHVMLFSNRVEKKLYWQSYVQKRPDIVIGLKNQFRSFHLFHLVDKFILKFSKKKYSGINKKLQFDPIRNFSQIHAAAWGGMFFHKDIIHRIGYPDQKYVVYMDDFDFSYRNILKGGQIYFVPKSILKDQEQSWNNVRNRFAFIQIALNSNHPALYYSIRNRVYFENLNHVNNRLVYLINMLIYSFIVVFVALVLLKFKNIFVYIRSLCDGLRKKMGVNSHYPL